MFDKIANVYYWNGIDPITKWFSIILRYAEFEPSEWLLKNVQPIGALQTNLA